MARCINYDADGTVMVYHTVPSKAGTSDFEHKSRVVLADIPYSKKQDGTDDPDMLLVTCPVPGCGTRVWVPLIGGEEDQRLHAKARQAKGQQPNYPAAVQSVIDDVKSRGGVPRLKSG